MLGGRAFRVALLISITAHSAILAAWPYFDSFLKVSKPAEHKTIEVNYLEIKVIPKLNAEKKIVEQIPTSGKALTRTEEIKKEQISSVKELAAKTKYVKLQTPKLTIKADSKQQEVIYVDYYNLIREKLKSTLFKMYKPPLGRGQVYLEFVLHSSGALAKVKISDEKSTPSRELKDLTLRALQKTSPFPPFPAGLSEPQVNFNVVISFHRQ